MKKNQQGDNARKSESADKKTVSGAGNDPITALKEEAEGFRNKYLRALADYQNLENRFRKDKEEVIRTTQVNFMNDILPFLDHLEMAESFSSDPGLKMIKEQLLKTIAGMGFTELEVQGKPFDPNIAEAIDIVPGEKDDVVAEVVRKGYMFKDRLVRPAQVKVSKKAENTK